MCGVLALILVSVGIWALTSYAVSQRTSEMETRLAIGAPPSGLVALFVRRAVAAVGGGLVAGAG